MHVFSSFIQCLQKQGAHVILVSDNPLELSDLEGVLHVYDWFKSWDIVDRLVGEKRRVLDLNNWDDQPQIFDAFEMFVNAGIIESGLLWFDFDQMTMKGREEVQGYWKDIKHVIVILQASDLFLTKADLQSRWKDVQVNDFVVGPDFSAPEELADNYFVANGMTVIIDFPKGIFIDIVGK
jgi:hypothetical protein